MSRIPDREPQAESAPLAVLDERSLLPENLSAFARFRRWGSGTDERYKVGTLQYTRLGLTMMFFWLLWGDLVWSLMEAVYPACMPLQLDRIGVPKNWTGYMMGTLGATINVVLVPIISVRSDRYRSRWGRRIPYILMTMVPLCLFMAALGFTDELGAWVRGSNWPDRLGISPIVLLVAILAVLMLLYDVFNVYVNCVYWYLFRDVIPDAFLGRFMSAFRMLGIVVGMIWGWYIQPHLETHTKYIYLGGAAVYLLGFSLMCFMVKEGEYPPPEAMPAGEPWFTRLWRNICTYARECFTHPLFITFYIANTLFAISWQTGMYRQYLFVRHLNFSLADMGKVGAIMAPIVFAVQFPMGWVVDRIHPIRGSLISSIGSTPFILAGYYFNDYTLGSYVLHAFTMYVAVSVLGMPFQQLGSAADLPLAMRLFPKEQFGQFASANAMLRHFTTIFGSFAGATFMGFVGDKFGYDGNRYSFLWQGGFHIIAVICMCIVYVYWKQLGGEKFVFDPEHPERVGASGTSLSRAALWRPILIGAIPAGIVLVLMIMGLLALIHR